MATESATNSFTMRIIGAAALDVAIYEEVEADRGATGQALLVVVLSSLAAGIGAPFGQTSLGNVLAVTIIAVLAWAAWALVTLQIGGRLMPEPQTNVDVGELLRTIGFATAPGMIRIFGIVPAAAVPSFVIAAVWMFVAMIVGVRQALDYKSTGRAVAVCFIGWVLSLAVSAVLGLLFSPTVS
jgi:Yip1 domain